MRNYRVNLGFAVFSDEKLSEQTSHVITKLTGNANFSSPPVTLANLKKLQSDFDDATVAAARGGTELTAIKNAKREELLDALRSIAAYVQSIASRDLPMLLSSGFEANSTNRAPVTLEAPSIITVANEATTTLTVRLQAVENARSYQVRASANGNGSTWLPTVDSTQARRIILGSLTPGATYTVQARAVGGATGYSEWSDPVSHMAM